jgi:hypothetical protein
MASANRRIRVFLQAIAANPRYRIATVPSGPGWYLRSPAAATDVAPDSPLEPVRLGARYRVRVGGPTSLPERSTVTRSDR